MRTKNKVGVQVALLVAAAAASLAHAAAPAEIVIPGERIFPESLTSAADGSVIIGSVGARTIFRAKPGSAAAEAWIQPGTDGMQGIFGVFADNKSNTLWACSGSFGAPGGAPSPPSALHSFDLKSGAPKGKYPLPTAGAFCNDAAVDSAGNVYATDTSNMEVVRLKKGGTALEVWAGNGAFGPKGGILDGIAVLGNRVLVNALGTSKLFSVAIDGDKAGAVAEVKLDRAIERPDGMRSFGKDSLLVVEGGGGGRLSRVTLSGDAGKTTTIKEGSYADGPVAVTVAGTTAYVLEGQLAAMFGPPGGTPPPAKPFRATAVEVGKP